MRMALGWECIRMCNPMSVRVSQSQCLGLKPFGVLRRTGVDGRWVSVDRVCGTRLCGLESRVYANHCRAFAD